MKAARDSGHAPITFCAISKFRREVILSAASYLALTLMDRLTLRWFACDLDILFNRAVQDERLVAIGVCSQGMKLLDSTSTFPKELDCTRASHPGEGPH